MGGGERLKDFSALYKKKHPSGMGMRGTNTYLATMPLKRFVWCAIQEGRHCLRTTEEVPFLGHFMAEAKESQELSWSGGSTRSSRKIVSSPGEYPGEVAEKSWRTVFCRPEEL
jgi:hypothetical protein